MDVPTFTFIAGAKKICLSEAKTTVEAKSSEVPFASLEIVLAVVGAIIITSSNVIKKYDPFLFHSQH